jgi:hypothetical protein
MITNANIMTKVYFPRLVMPLSGILSPLVDFANGIAILIAEGRVSILYNRPAGILAGFLDKLTCFRLAGYGVSQVDGAENWKSLPE